MSIFVELEKAEPMPILKSSALELHQKQLGYFKHF